MKTKLKNEKLGVNGYMKSTVRAFPLSVIATALFASSFAIANDDQTRSAFFAKDKVENQAPSSAEEKPKAFFSKNVDSDTPDIEDETTETNKVFFNAEERKKDLLENASSITGIYDVDSYQTSDGATEIRVNFNSFPVTPTAKKLANPDRLVLDFGDVADEIRETLTFNATKQVKNLRLDRNDKGKLTLELDLAEYGRFTTRKVDGSFFLKIYPKVYAETKVSAESKNGVSGIQFKRTKGGEDQAIINLLSSDTPVAVKQNGNKIELRFKGNKLPASAIKTQNFNDLKAIIASSKAYNQGFDGVVELTVNGGFDYMAYQLENKLTINVAKKKASKAVSATEFGADGYSGRKISMDFQDVEIRRVLQMIANYVGVNIITSDAVTGNVSLRVQDVPWDQALSIMLKSKGLSQRRDGKVVWVAPTTEVVKQETEEARAYAQSITLAPMITSIIQLNYANAQEISKLIAMKGLEEKDGDEFNRQHMMNRLNANGDDSRLLSPRGAVNADPRTNTLIVVDTQQKVEEIKRIVSQLDIPVRQVLVEARIVRATTNFSKNMGVKWGIAKDSGQSVAANMGNLYATSKYGKANEAETVDSAVGLDLGQSSAVSSIAFGLINTTDTLLGLELSALQSDGLGEVLSQPKVMTGDKQEATIRSGVKLPYKTVSEDSGTNTTFQDAILELTVTPSITPEGTVQMKLVINKDTQGQLTDAGYAIDTNQLITNVLVNDGETVVLGGLYEDTKTNSVEKVPFLGDIPFLGKAFQSKSKSESKQELLIFITPKVIHDPTSKSSFRDLNKSKLR